MGFICDRCGTLIDPSPPNREYSKPKNGMDIAFMGNYSGFMEDDFFGHLCENCCKLFCEFMGEKFFIKEKSAEEEEEYGCQDY